MMNLVVGPTRRSGPPPAHAATEAAAAPTAGVTFSPAALFGLSQAIFGLHNPRALSTVLGGMIAGLLLDRFLSTLGGHSGPVLSLLGLLAFFVASATGVNAAGVLLMAQAKRLPPRGLQAAILFGLKCVPRLFVLWAALALLGMVVIVVMGLACFVSRIPLIGPLLLAVVFPVTVLASGATVCGLALCLVLVLPAVWEGATLSAAMAVVLAIARSRLVEALLLLAALSGLTVAVGCVVVGVVWAGLMPMLAALARVIGNGAVPGIADLLRAYANGALGSPDGFDANATAALIGSGLLWSFAGSLISLVWLLGLNLVYLRLADGLGEGRAEKPLRPGVDESRQHAAELARKAGAASERAREVVRTAAFAAKARDVERRKAASGEAIRRRAAADEFAPAGTKTRADDDRTVSFTASGKCPHCFSGIEPDDVFCGICGYKLV